MSIQIQNSVQSSTHVIYTQYLQIQYKLQSLSARLNTQYKPQHVVQASNIQCHTQNS